MEPETLTLKSNISKLKQLRYRAVNDIYVKSSIIDKASYLLPTLDLQPYLSVTKEGNIGLEYGREDGSFLNFYIYDEPNVHMVVILMNEAGDRRHVRALVNPEEVNKKIHDFYEIAK